jgi:hypothetical protein
MNYANSCSAGMHKDDQRCTDLIETTSNALCDDTAAVMLLAVQKDNLELCIKQAVRWYVLKLVFNGTRMRAAWMHYRFHEQRPGSADAVVTLCIKAFPSIWVCRSTEF